MDIIKGETLSGFMVSVTNDGKTLNIYESDCTFSDGVGEIIVEGLPEYNIKEITDAEVTQFFHFANEYFESLKAYMSMDEE